MAVAQISRGDGRALATAPGFVLRSDAAVAFDNANKAFGKDVILTGAWRSYETQERLFRERYQLGGWSPVGDYRTWNGRVWARVRGAAAAVPGTSNHGGGVAFDAKTRRDSSDPSHSKAVVFTSWNDRDRTGWLKAAREFGWRDDEGRRVGELWHITYYPHLDKHRGDIITPGKKPKSKRKPHRIATIRRGDDTWRTGLVQKRLTGYGSYNGKIDDKFGPRTENAVKDFQRARGLVVDGVVGPNTWYELAQGAEYGDRNEIKVDIAQRIAGLKGKKDVDGIAGNVFKHRWKQIQRWLGVVPDAKVGPNTVSKLQQKG